MVGATEREESYGGQTLINLDALGYEGEVWGVNPKRDRVHGRPCFPSLSELPGVPDAVVVAVPAAAVPGVVDDAGELGCGGAVVYGAGFAEVEEGRRLEQELIACARRHDLPVCGPNGNGIVSFPERVALWGDAVYPREGGEIAIISQSGNQAVNAISVRRGLRFHTVISCGNAAVIEPAEYLLYLAEHERGIRSVALNLETDGDGAALAEALAACIDAGIGVAVLKAGESEVGAAAAAAHTGAVAGDQRAFEALLAEAGAARAADFHDLLELAKTLAVRRPGAGGLGGLAVMTCSGGDSSSAGDEAQRRGLRFPSFTEATEARLVELLPSAATIQNPLDYTAMIWGERERLRDMIVAVAEDPGVERVLIFYDEPIGLYGDTKASWDAVLGGILDGATASPVPVVISSTLPELLQDESAARMLAAGVAGVAGLRTGIACAAALGAEPGDPARLREIAAVARRAGEQPEGGGERWLAEHAAKALIREAGVPVVEGRLAADAADAVAIQAELGGPVVAKLSGERLQHKTELGALELDLVTETEVRDAHGRLVALGLGEVLIERHVPAGVELLVAARRDGVVPTVVVGLGGVWTEALSDAAVVPLPASPERVECAMRGLRGAALLTGGRGRPELDIAAVARLAAAAAEVLIDAGLELVEMNPVMVYEDGAVVVDALARKTATVPAASAAAVRP